MFAKNIYKQQPAELHIYEDLRSGLLLPSNREALMEELKRLSENAQAEVGKLLEKIAAPVEILTSPPIITPHLSFKVSRTNRACSCSEVCS
jgi:hypothetical protein